MVGISCRNNHVPHPSQSNAPFAQSAKQRKEHVSLSTTSFSDRRPQGRKRRGSGGVTGLLSGTFTSEKYISMLERGQRELKPIRRAYEAWVEAGLPLDWDRQAFEAERKMDSKKHLAK